MKPPVCDSVFDVAFWLSDRALEDGEYLQPQKLQRMLYLAQAYYGAAARGQKLMPCIFVVSRLGPLEPATWRAFENGPPQVNAQPIPSTQKHFLDSLWRRFGAHTADYLTKMVMNHPPFVQALAHGNRAEIPFEEMIAYYGRAPDEREAGSRDAAPPLDNVLRPRVLRSHKGRPVNVHAWVPKKRVDVPE